MKVQNYYYSYQSFLAHAFTKACILACLLVCTATASISQRIIYFRDSTNVSNIWLNANAQTDQAGLDFRTQWANTLFLRDTILKAIGKPPLPTYTRKDGSYQFYEYILDTSISDLYFSGYNTFGSVCSKVSGYIMSHLNNINVFEVKNSELDKLEIGSNNIQYLRVSNCKIIDLRILNTCLGEIVISNVKVNNLHFEGVSRPQRLTISNLRVNSHLGEDSTLLDLTPLDLEGSFLCNLNITPEDIARVKLNYFMYTLDFSYATRTAQSTLFAIKQASYLALIANQQKNGFTAGYEKAMGEFKEIQYFDKYGPASATLLNWVDKNWWGYGFRKQLIFRNSLIILLFFCSVNSLFYKQLLYNTYRLDEFIKIDQRLNNSKGNNGKKVLRSLIHCVLYTSFIFFAFRLDYDRIRLKSLPLSFLVIIEFVLGIICLAYLAGYIVST